MSVTSKILLGRTNLEKLSASEFRNIDFQNAGFPDVLLITVYLLYGEKVLEFYVKQFLGIPHPLFFTRNGKTGLVLRRSDSELRMPADFPEQVIDYVKTLNLRDQPGQEAGTAQKEPLGEGEGEQSLLNIKTVSYFSRPDSLGNVPREPLDDDLLLKVVRTFVQLVDHKLSDGFFVSYHKLLENSAIFFGRKSSYFSRKLHKLSLIHI